MELRKMLKPQRLGNLSLPDMELTEDKKTCRKFGPCGVGKKAIYLNSFYIERRYYVPMKSVKRIFKRIAMSKGGFTGKGAFGTLPYLVVEYDDGKEKHIRRREWPPTMFMPFMRKGIMSGSVVLKESLPVTIYGRILIHITRLIA